MLREMPPTVSLRKMKERKLKKRSVRTMWSPRVEANLYSECACAVSLQRHYRGETELEDKKKKTRIKSASQQQLVMLRTCSSCKAMCFFFSMFLVTRPHSSWLKIKKKKKKKRKRKKKKKKKKKKKTDVKMINQTKIVRLASRSAAGARHFHVALADS